MKAIVFGSLGVVIAATASAETKIDWAHGFATATGVGVADRHAPNPAIARSTARRGADDAAKAAIAAAIGAIPVAGGGTVGARAASDKAVAARVADAVAHAITLAADPDTDGAWTVTLGVPLEALHQALDGGPRPLHGNDTGATIVVLRASIPQAIGYRIAGAPAALVWRDAEDGKLPSTTATASGATLTLAHPLGTPATLYMVIP